MKNILLVEDDNDIHNIIHTLLKNNNYNVYNAYSGTEALIMLEENEIDLLLLDLMLPGLPGEEIIKKYNHIPIIVLSAKIGIDDKVNCLLSGANDYITKPFNNEELLARIKVQLKLNKNVQKLKYRELSLNQDYDLQIGEYHIKLTKTEYAIMKQLIFNQGKVIPKSSLLDLISFDTEDCDENSLRVHISNLRKKMKKFTNTEYIESVWGIGFKLKS